MRSLLTLLLFLTAVASAQEGLAPGGVPPELRRYLELTDPQVSSIQQLNAQLNAYRSGKANRQFQVQRELTEELARDPLDPTAIGLRHVELESIQRELEAEQTKTTTAIQTLLTPAQRARLDGLAEVLRQHNTACSAVALNMLPATSASPSIIPSSRVSPSAGCQTLIRNLIPVLLPQVP
jgi:Spy/CpxP family protein refolding chaperone